MSLGANPGGYVSYRSNIDSDGDGAGDCWERGGVLAVRFPTLEIVRHVSDPTTQASDGDSLGDADELLNRIRVDIGDLGDYVLSDVTEGTDALSERGVSQFYWAPPGDPSETDSDSDGLDDFEESLIRGTSPFRQDTDGDGIIDPFDDDPLTPRFDGAISGLGPDNLFVSTEAIAAGNAAQFDIDISQPGTFIRFSPLCLQHPAARVAAFLGPTSRSRSITTTRGFAYLPARGTSQLFAELSRLRLSSCALVA